MPTKVKVGGSWVDPTNIRYRSGGSWAAPTAIWAKVSGAWQKVWPNIAPLSASASPLNLTGTRIGAGVLSRTTTITASGGVPPYSYSTIWSSGGAGLSVINGGTSNPGASGSNSPTNTYTGTLRCRVTDAASNYVDVFIGVSLSWES